MKRSILVEPNGPRWMGYLLARTAILHGGDRVGNVVPFATEPVNVPGRGILQIPTVSGNSIRHQLREALAHLWLRLLSPDGNGARRALRIPPKLYYMLFSGGANQGGDGSHFDFDERRATFDLMPPIAVFGTARDGGTYAGSVGVLPAQPISRETWDLLLPPQPSAAWPCGRVAAESIAARVWAQRPSSALRMTATRQYTRTDQLRTRSPHWVKGDVAGGLAVEPAVAAMVDAAAGKKRSARGKGKGDDKTPQQMIFAAQVLVKGIALHHGVYFIQPPSPLVLSAFGAAVRAWADNAIIGGRAAIGHGLVEPYYQAELPDPRPFLEYVEAHRETMRRYLGDKHGADLTPYEVPADDDGGDEAAA